MEFLLGRVYVNEPIGRNSATQYISQTYLTNLRRRGMMSAYLDEYSEDGIDRFMKLAFTLATEESEEAQFAITQNMEAWTKEVMNKVGSPDKITAY